MINYSYREILKIVLPLIIAGFGQSVIYITDILFLGRLGPVALGASAIAGLFYSSLMMIGFGISSGMQVLIAQKYGEDKKEEINLYLLNGIFLQLVNAVLLTGLYFAFRVPLLNLLVKNEELRAATSNFSSIRVLGFIPYFLFYSYRAYYLGIGQTKVISVATIVMSLFNLILNPILIYGFNNLINPLGYVGSAWASVISEWVSMFLIMLYYSYHKKSARFISHLRTDLCKKIMSISFPLILQHFISVFSWFLFFVFIEKMGSQELAVSNIVRAVYILIMAPILAFSHSAVTIIGQLTGAGEYQQLFKVMKKLSLLSMLFTFPFSMLSFFTPQYLMQIFTNNLELIRYGIPVMKIVAFALIYFSVSLPWLSAVTGLGKTKQAFLIELFSFVIYIFASYVFVFVWKWPLAMIWFNEFVYFTCIMGFSFFVFNRFVQHKLIQVNVK
ncbi:MAG: MATE family efflux transporter [Bacteroidia bacterium]|nr:MATE family efflux transporter [Bacteroidia bacterium]